MPKCENCQRLERNITEMQAEIDALRSQCGKQIKAGASLREQLARLLEELNTALKMIDPKALQSTRDYAIKLAREGHYENQRIALLKAEIDQLFAPVTEDEASELAAEFHDGYGIRGTNALLAARKEGSRT